MDVYKILEESGKNLYLVDLDFLEEELATGNYTPEYIEKCREKIDVLRAWFTSAPESGEAEKTEDAVPEKKGSGVFMGLGDLVPGDAGPAAQSVSTEDNIFSNISSIRKSPDYKADFKTYILKNQEIDEDFLEKNFSFFEQWELDLILEKKQLSEPFLEKFFGALSHDKIARYQKFSESFFMKHYGQLNENVVLKFGRNEWRAKDKRSKQLDVFLRLKGVRI